MVLLMGTNSIDTMGIKADGLGGGGGGDAGGGGYAAKSLSDLVMGFFEEEESRWPKRQDLFESSFEEDEEESSESASERRAFWESQFQVLKGLLSPTNSIEARLQRTVESAVSSLRAESSSTCSCSGSNNTVPCRSCTLRQVSARLRRGGHDAAVCLSRWRSTPALPAGDHSYIDIVVAPSATSPNSKAPRRIIIEPAFRAEFEMARACPEYSALVALLPEVFVGRAERLRSLLKVVCGAAKKCLNDSGMHVAPWRKHRYMVSKWLSAPAERIVDGVGEAKLDLQEVEKEKALTAAMSPPTPAKRSPRLRASMLTFDLLDGKLPAATALYTAVEVV